MNNLLSLENSISSKKIPRSTFDDPNISSLLTHLQQYNLIPKNRSNVNLQIKGLETPLYSKPMNMPQRSMKELS